MESAKEMGPCESCKAIDASSLWSEEYIDGYQSDRDVPSDPETEEEDDLDENAGLDDESTIIKKVWGSDSEDSEDSTEETEDGDKDNAAKPKQRVRRFYIKMPSGKKKNVSQPHLQKGEWSCSRRVTRRVALKTHMKEYKLVKKEMHATIVLHFGYNFTKYNIVKIEKLINGCMWKEYLHRSKEIRAEHGYMNQRMLFHGSTVVDDIIKQGFNEQFSNTNGMFGAGLYFAKHSSKANEYAFGAAKIKGCIPHKDKNCMICVRKMLLCRVTLGKTKYEDTVAQHYHPPKGYNSVTGVPNPIKKKHLKYPEYIVYRREQVYPEFYIEYKLAM